MEKKRNYNSSQIQQIIPLNNPCLNINNGDK